VCAKEGENTWSVGWCVSEKKRQYMSRDKCCASFNQKKISACRYYVCETVSD